MGAEGMPDLQGAQEQGSASGTQAREGHMPQCPPHSGELVATSPAHFPWEMCFQDLVVAWSD